MEVTDQEDETTEAMLAVSAMQPRKPRDYDREEVVVRIQIYEYYT